MTALVTDIGLKAVVDSLVAADAIKFIGWGSGSGQGVSATDLAAALPESRSEGSLTVATTTTTDDTLRVTGTIVATDARSVSEVGVFSDPTGAEMAVYGDFTAVNLSVNDSIAFTIDVAVDQA